MSNNVTVLMLGYKAQSGKDTFYSVAKDLGYMRSAFADKLKDVVKDLYQFSDDQMYGSLKDVEDVRYINTVDQQKILSPEWERDIDMVNLALDNGMESEDMQIDNPEYKPFFTPRRILQIFGQQQRLLNPDIWADYVFNVTIPSLVSVGHKRIIITDFRFRNEATVAKKWSTRNNANLKFIKISRPSIISNDTDISENDLNQFSEWSYYLNNTGTLEEYQSSSIKFIRTVLNS